MTELKQLEFKEWPKIVRMSNVLTQLRASDNPDSAKTADTIEALYKQFGSTCTRHGHLDDPILALVHIQDEDGDKLVFICPWCSDEALLKKWEDEKPS